MTSENETHHIEWQGISIEIHYCRSWSESFEQIYGYSLCHLEVKSVHPAKAPLPFTETGYRSHFTNAADIKAEGGPVAYVKAWLECASQSKEWKERQAAALQYTLF